MAINTGDSQNPTNPFFDHVFSSKKPTFLQVQGLTVVVIIIIIIIIMKVSYISPATHVAHAPKMCPNRDVTLPARPAGRAAMASVHVAKAAEDDARGDEGWKWKCTLPEANSSHLKMMVSNRNLNKNPGVPHFQGVYQAWLGLFNRWLMSILEGTDVLINICFVEL